MDSSGDRRTDSMMSYEEVSPRLSDARASTSIVEVSILQMLPRDDEMEYRVEPSCVTTSRVPLVDPAFVGSMHPASFRPIAEIEGKDPASTVCGAESDGSEVSFACAAATGAQANPVTKHIAATSIAATFDGCDDEFDGMP